MRTQVKRAFTLIEILIVVVILGILAAIVIPQFTDASTQASESSLKSQLQTIRGQLELYKVKHADVYPDLITNGWSDLINDGYLQSPPKNPLQFNANGNPSTDVAAAAAAGVGWVWVADPDGDAATADGELTAVGSDGTTFQDSDGNPF